MKTKTQLLSNDEEIDSLNTEQKGQKGQLNKKEKVISPKNAQLATQKNNFIQALRSNGGNVSKALEASSLIRNTAYSHFKEDTEFADAWRAAQEQSVDELFEEARKRAVLGDEKLVRDKSGKVIGTTFEKSDTLLIYLMKQGEAQKKWRGRMIQVGNLALDTISRFGVSAGLSKEQIEQLQAELIEAFKNVSLI